MAMSGDGPSLGDVKSLQWSDIGDATSAGVLKAMPEQLVAKTQPPV